MKRCLDYNSSGLLIKATYLYLHIPLVLEAKMAVSKRLTFSTGNYLPGMASYKGR